MRWYRSIKYACHRIIGAIFPRWSINSIDDRIEERLNRSDHNKILTFTETMPQFGNGGDAFKEYVSANIRYPKREKDRHVTGRVVVQFLITRSGKVKRVRIKQSVSKGIDREVIRMIKGMPRWIPGKQNEKPVPVKLTLPITFSLS